MNSRYRLLTRSIRIGDYVIPKYPDISPRLTKESGGNKWLICCGRLFYIYHVNGKWHSIADMRLYSKFAPAMTDYGEVAGTLRQSQQQIERYWVRLKVDRHAV